MFEQEFQAIELEMIRLQKNFNSGMRDLNDQYQALKKKVHDLEQKETKKLQK